MVGALFGDFKEYAVPAPHPRPQCDLRAGIFSRGGGELALEAAVEGADPLVCFSSSDAQITPLGQEKHLSLGISKRSVHWRASVGGG